MRWLCLPLVLIATAPLACSVPVCVVAPDSLRFTRVITFDDLPSGFGVGREVAGILRQPGASLGERLAGQILRNDGGFDRADGLPIAPLALVDGGPGRGMGAMRLWGTTILHGHGPTGFPRTDAVGEGALAILFDRDQPALAFDIVGGEAGTAFVSFFRRDGTRLHRITLSGLGEETVTFLRAGHIPDIAGVVIENADPQGIGIDNLRFEFDELMGTLHLPDRDRLTAPDQADPAPLPSVPV